jgi:hypothetical protein
VPAPVLRWRDQEGFVVKNASGNDAWRPDDLSPEEEIAEGDSAARRDEPIMPPTRPEGPIPGEYERGAEGKRSRPDVKE